MEKVLWSQTSKRFRGHRNINHQGTPLDVLGTSVKWDTVSGPKQYVVDTLTPVQMVSNVQLHN